MIFVVRAWKACFFSGAVGLKVVVNVEKRPVLLKRVWRVDACDLKGAGLDWRKSKSVSFGL